MEQKDNKKKKKADELELKEERRKNKESVKFGRSLYECLFWNINYCKQRNRRDLAV